MMTRIYLPAVPKIAAIFEEECTALGAESVDTVQDEPRLFARAVCGAAQLIAVGDEVRGGVAVRVDGPDVFVHSYSLRKVCVNGAIMPLAQGTTSIQRVETEEVAGAAAFTAGFENELRETIRSCAAAAPLSQSVETMRAMADMEATRFIPIMMMLIHARGLARGALRQVLERYSSSGDRSAFGLVNAVTSV